MDLIGVIGLVIVLVVSYLYISFAITPKGPDWRKLIVLGGCLSALAVLLLILGWFF